MMVANRFPPGPHTGFFDLSLAKRLQTERLDYPLELARTYGDFVHFRLGPVHLYFANHPDLVREVLVTRGKSFRKLPRLIRCLREVDGNGLVLSEGDFWLRQRRLVQPAFNVKRFDGYAKTIVDCARQAVDSWSPGSELNVPLAMRRLTLAIVARTLFGADISGSEEALGAATETISEIVTVQTGRMIQLPIWIPTAENRRKRQAIEVVDRVIRRIIRERRVSGEDRGDLLSMLLAAVDEEGDGTGMSDEQVRNESITLFNAGHDTTASALTWTWYLLATHPEIAERVREEAQTVLRGRRAAYADMPALAYTTRVVKESMRLFPPTWALIPRVATQSLTIGGYELPKGAWVYMYPWVLHRDPRFFPDPERFDPDRFAPDRADSIPQHAYIPFGAGPHVCIGNTFATMEMALALATIVPRCRLTFPADHPPVVPEALIAIRPRDGLTLRLEQQTQPEPLVATSQS
jgi:cytochrome P450